MQRLDTDHRHSSVFPRPPIHTHSAMHRVRPPLQALLYLPLPLSFGAGCLSGLGVCWWLVLTWLGSSPPPPARSSLWFFLDRKQRLHMRGGAALGSRMRGGAAWAVVCWCGRTGGDEVEDFHGSSFFFLQHWLLALLFSRAVTA